MAGIQRLYRIEARRDDESMVVEDRAEVRGKESKPVPAKIKARLEADHGGGRILPPAPLARR